MTTARTLPQLHAQLRRWIAGQDRPHVRAAVELLIAHDGWLRRRDFLTAAVHTDEHGDHGAAGSLAWINFRDAREAFTAGHFLPASSTELAMLDLAIALGEDRYRLSQMGPANSRAIAAAVRTALDLDRHPPGHPGTDAERAAVIGNVESFRDSLAYSSALAVAVDETQQLHADETGDAVDHSEAAARLAHLIALGRATATATEAGRDGQP